MSRNRNLHEIGSEQYGHITSGQAAAAGLTGRQRRRRIEAGDFQPAGVHVVRNAFAERSTVGDVLALVLDCGPGAVASGPTAAGLHEFDGIGLRPPFHVTVPRGRYVDRAPHVVHTSLDLSGEDQTLRLGIPTMTPVRTLIDLARFVRADTLTAALDGALRDRKLTEDRLHARIATFRSQGRYGIPKLLDVVEGIEATRGGHSWLERRFLRVCADAGLPRPVTQQVLTNVKGRKVRVDFEFPGTPVVVEVLGYHWHRGSREQLSRDSERINALVMTGRVPLQFTYEHVTLEVPWLISQLRTALQIRSLSA